MFKRPHHQKIAQVLLMLDGAVLREHRCYFGGGTAIALRCDEFRESVDIDFLVSDRASYRKLRELITTANSLAPITRDLLPPLQLAREVRADQYGIRCLLAMGEVSIKFEIVLEGRIDFLPAKKGDEICGVRTLSLIDLAASKLLANSDRWADDAVFSRDIIDLAMLNVSRREFTAAFEKAREAYGDCIARDAHLALERLKSRRGWLDRCMDALAIKMPKAVLWERLRSLRLPEV